MAGLPGGRADYSNPLVTPPTTRRKGNDRPMANGQPTYPIGYPPDPGAGGPTRSIDEGIEGPLAPRGGGGGNAGLTNTGSPGPGGTTSRQTPNVLDVADAIENDTFKPGEGAKKPRSVAGGSGRRH